MYSDAPQAKKFLSMCSGEDGMTYKGTCMFAPSPVDEPQISEESEDDDAGSENEERTTLICLNHNNAIITPVKPNLPSPISDTFDSETQTYIPESSHGRPSLSSINEVPSSSSNKALCKAVYNDGSVTTSLIPKRRLSRKKSVKIESIKSHSESPAPTTSSLLQRRGTSKRSVREQDFCSIQPALICASPNDMYFYLVMDRNSRDCKNVIGEVAGGMTIIKNASMQRPVSAVLIYDCGLAIRKWELSQH